MHKKSADSDLESLCIEDLDLHPSLVVALLVRPLCHVQLLVGQPLVVSEIEIFNYMVGQSLV